MNTELTLATFQTVLKLVDEVRGIPVEFLDALIKEGEAAAPLKFAGELGAEMLVRMKLLRQWVNQAREQTRTPAEMKDATAKAAAEFLADAMRRMRP